MSTGDLKSIDKLRQRIKLYNAEPAFTYLNEVADEIEAEIAERYIELPVDADGVPIRVGDLIEFGENGERLEVTHFGWTRHGDPTVAYRRPNGTLDCSCLGTETRHVKHLTIEDMLEEFSDKCCVHTRDELNIIPELIAKYAEEIRGMMA